jgi:CDP-L-myo-inositol myo-inositolphosphotransferase
MKAVILAAGLGLRLGGKPKPLLKVGGIEIIYRTMKLLSPHVDEYIVVAGRYYDEISEFLKNTGFKFRMVKNDHPEWGNGYSLLLARDFVDDRFVLVMGDHVYSREFVEQAVKGEGLIGDADARFVDVDEATKVKIENGRILEIGKELVDYDCIDTGFFILDKSIFEVADRFKNYEELKVSDIVKAARIKVSLVNGNFWMDVDTEDDLKRANYLLVRTSVKSIGDGFVSRYLNRKISTRISSKLVNKVSPNQMTMVSFFVGLLSALFVFVDVRIAGLVYQISSILDGCDGEIARASLRQSRFGGYADSILDRYVDFLFLTAVAILNPSSLPIVIFAIFGGVMVSYSTEKYRADFAGNIYAEIPAVKYLIGKRDERVFLIMVFCLFGLIYEMFLLIALITNLRVVLTLLLVERRKRLIAAN